MDYFYRFKDYLCGANPSNIQVKDIQVYNICQKCNRNVALFICLECKGINFFCNKCFDTNHSSTAGTNSNQNSVFPNINNHKKEELTKYLSKCENHAESKKEYFCEDCNKSICLKCKNSNIHEKHNLIGIIDKENEIRQKIQSLISESQKIKDKVEVLKGLLNSKKNQISTMLEDLKKEVKDASKKVELMIKKREDEISNSITELEKPNLDGIMNIYNELSNHELALKELGNIFSLSSLNILSKVSSGSNISQEIDQHCKLSGKVNGLEKQILDFSNEQINMLSLDISKISQSINELHFSIKPISRLKMVKSNENSTSRNLGEFSRHLIPQKNDLEDESKEIIQKKHSNKIEYPTLSKRFHSDDS